MRSWRGRRWSALARRDERIRETRSLEGFLDAERARLFDDASPERREQLRAAERTREVYRAWNAVCAGTREGKHATGLHFAAERNELIVYMDAPSWTQEMTMLREIIRARMAAKGVDIDALVFKTSREGYRSAAEGAGSAAKHRASAVAPRPAPRREELSAAESDRLDREVAPIENEALRKALKSAMKASLEWKETTTE